ncbi:MAG: L,D-transpeptidase [Myxococcota bacterium]
MLLLAALATLLNADAPACPTRGVALVVDTAAHSLLLCDGGAPVRRFEVAIGQNGPAPKRVGWAQTPLGTFTLAAPRPSKQFHVFVPLVNPDPRRFTAWAIGVHGPQRGWENAGHVNVESDWTLGCIAVASDDEIDAIAAFVRARGVKRIDVR